MTPPYQPGPYGQPNQDPWGQPSGGGYGQYGQQSPQGQPQQPQYGDQWGNEQTQRFGPAQQYGQTQQFGAPQYGGGVPPQPPKSRTGMIVAIVAIAVLVVGGAGVGIYFATKGDDNKNTAGGTTTTAVTDTSDTSSEEDSTDETTEDTTTEESGGGSASDAQPGDCIKVNSAGASNADVETIDCSADEAIYKVATREEDSTATCPNESYVQYTEDGTLSLCMELNVHDGDCLEVGENSDQRADCSSPSATHRVVGVLDGVDDETQCDEESTDVITYPQPPLTICLVSPAS